MILVWLRFEPKTKTLKLINQNQTARAKPQAKVGFLNTMELLTCVDFFIPLEENLRFSLFWSCLIDGQSNIKLSWIAVFAKKWTLHGNLFIRDKTTQYHHHIIFVLGGITHRTTWCWSLTLRLIENYFFRKL